jgi:HD-GYP domain-containing protein (c-di-GMP phosphodiesterase class II)
VSIGCADSLQASSEPAGLIIASELAMNRAKQLGRDRVCRFDHVPGAETASDPFQLHRLLQDASLATIQALAAAVDAKDAYTEGHSRRVAEYASDLARYLGRKDAEVDLIYRTGTLHDVGKIGVPDSILKKPGRLTEEERAIMETHPVLGEVIVRKAPQLEDTIPGVRHHHERWDGQGYPDGLAGDHIPFMARVLAVADTFDAMTSDRPYRKGMAWDVSLEAILEGAETQFDPSMANAFVRMMRARQIRKAA